MTRATIDAHDQAIALGQNTVFNMLFDSQQFVASIIFREPRAPAIWWTPDYKQVTIDAETVDLEKLRAGVQDMLRDSWDLLFTLTDGKKFANKLPDDFKDDLRNDSRGYSFLNHGPFTDIPHALLAHLVEESHWKLFSVDADGRLSFNKPAMLQYLDKSAQLNKLLSILAFVLPVMSTRISQFSDNKIRNLDRHRNLHMMFQEMFDLVQYHKMTNLTGVDVCIPVFYPPGLQEIVLEYLAGGIREVETMLGRIAYGTEAESHYQS